MSSISMLVTEHQALSSETRRKHPNVSSVSERALILLRTVTLILANGERSEEAILTSFRPMPGALEMDWVIHHRILTPLNFRS